MNSSASQFSTFFCAKNATILSYFLKKYGLSSNITNSYFQKFHVKSYLDIVKWQQKYVLPLFRSTNASCNNSSCSLQSILLYPPSSYQDKNLSCMRCKIKTCSNRVFIKKVVLFYKKFYTKRGEKHERFGGLIATT